MVISPKLMPFYKFTLIFGDNVFGSYFCTMLANGHIHHHHNLP